MTSNATTTIYDISITRADGSSTTLAEYAGKVLLIVNVASKCGFTKQYDGLEALYRTYRDAGLIVLGFPANDFAGQEPGTDEEIQEFCRSTYGVEFPVFAKIVVTGEAKHPLYDLLTKARPQAEFKPESGLLARLAQRGPVPEPGEITWNFEKFLVDRSGNVVGRFAPDTTPEDEAIVTAIRKLLPV